METRTNGLCNLGLGFREIQTPIWPPVQRIPRVGRCGDFGLVGLEGAIRTVHSSLPPPVQERLAPLYQRIPEDPANTKASVCER